MSHDHNHEHGNSLLGDHVAPLSLYLKVGGALLFLTFITVWIAQFDFGPLNMFVAMAVATVKASLVALFFMHLAHDERLNGLVFGFGLIFLALFFIFTVVDFSGREFVDPTRGTYAVKNAEMNKLRTDKETSIQGVKGLPREDVPPEGERLRKTPEAPKVPGGFEQPGAVPGAMPPGGAVPVPGAVPAPGAAPAADPAAAPAALPAAAPAPAAVPAPAAAPAPAPANP